MFNLTTTESDLIDQLLNCLEEAISTILDVSLNYANKTKIQKLLYLAIDEFDIPVTYSWYLAGAVVPDRSIGPSSLNGQTTGPETPNGPTIPSSTDEYDSDSSPNTESPTDSIPVDPIMFRDDHDEGNTESVDADLSTYVDRETLLDFYRSEIPTVWHQETMRFLQNFYQEKAPKEYQLLYIESTHLRTHLGELSETVEAHLDGETPTRSIESLRKSIELSISDLHYYLRQDEQLRQTFTVVVDGTDMLEDAILMLDKLPEEEFTQKHLTLLQELQDFFYYYVWKYPCLLISLGDCNRPLC